MNNSSQVVGTKFIVISYAARAPLTRPSRVCVSTSVCIVNYERRVKTVLTYRCLRCLR